MVFLSYFVIEHNLKDSSSNFEVLRKKFTINQLRPPKENLDFFYFSCSLLALFKIVYM